MRKSAFARRIGVSPSRVSQLIADGMPVELDDTINEERALSWCRENVRAPWQMRLGGSAGETVPTRNSFQVFDWSGVAGEIVDAAARSAIEGETSSKSEEVSA